MKISKVELRRIIKEELAKLTEWTGTIVAPPVAPPRGYEAPKPPVSLDYPDTSAVKADVPSTGGRRAGGVGPKGTPSIPTDPPAGVGAPVVSRESVPVPVGEEKPGIYSFGRSEPVPIGQASVGISGEKEIEGVGTIHGSADLPIARGARETVSDYTTHGIHDTDFSHPLASWRTGGYSLEEPTGPRLSAGYSTRGSTYGLPGGIDVGGELTMTTGGEMPLLGGEINLSKEIGDYSMKVRNTYGDFDLAKGMQGRMVGASLGRNIGNAHIEAGLDIPKGEGGLPSLDQAQAFLHAGGDLGSLSVILGPDLLQTGPGLNFQLDLIGLGKRMGLIKNNNLEEATLKRWKKLIK